MLKYPPEWFPQRIAFENFQLVSDNFPLFRWYLNDLITATSATMLVLITGSMAGDAFARLPFRWKELAFYVLMLALLVPPEVTFIPLFGLSNVGLGNTYPALFLPLVANAFALFLFRDFFEQLPQELEDAARVDGASRWQVYLRIVLPLSTPVLVAVAILRFMTSWNNFMWPLIIASSDETKTLPVGMNQFAPAGGMSPVGYGLTVAGTTMAGTTMAGTCQHRQHGREEHAEDQWRKPWGANGCRHGDDAHGQHQNADRGIDRQQGTMDEPVAVQHLWQLAVDLGQALRGPRRSATEATMTATATIATPMLSTSVAIVWAAVRSNSTRFMADRRGRARRVGFPPHPRPVLYSQRGGGVDRLP